jgi:hypothetical protein
MPPSTLFCAGGEAGAMDAAGFLNDDLPSYAERAFLEGGVRAVVRA